MRLVIADDHRLVREGIRWMLDGEEGIEVVAEVGDGQELLQMLAEQAVDIVLLDVRMPRLGGIDALAKLRELPDPPQVVILSMYRDPALVRRATQLGAAGYLLKNTTREELLLALRVVAAGHGYVQGEVSGTLLDPIVRHETTGRPSTLSPREIEVLRLVADGLGNRQVAERLGMSEATVKTHLKEIFARLGVANRAEATAVAIRRGLIA